MTIAPLDIDAAANNPLDILEELVVANEWPLAPRRARALFYLRLRYANTGKPSKRDHRPSGPREREALAWSFRPLF